MTDCLSQAILDFHSDKRIDVAFDAPEISSDGGWLLLRQMDDKLGLTEWFAALVPDDRASQKVEHTRREQVRQRVLQIAMAYEDCNDLRLEVTDVSPQLGRKQMDTLRLRLLKVAAIVTQSVRRILLRLPAVFPLRATFRALLRRLNVPGLATAT